MQDCIYERNQIKNAISHATEQLVVHKAMLNQQVRQFIHGKTSDYFNYMNIVFKNMDRIGTMFQKYEGLYGNSQRLREYFKLLAEHYSNRMHLPIKLKSGTGDAINAVKKIGEMKALKEYYHALRSKKMSLNDDKVIVSSEITESDKEIKTLDEFDQKVRVAILKANSILTELKGHITDNVKAIQEAQQYVNVATDPKISMEEKLKRLSIEGYRDGNNDKIGGMANLGLFSKEEVEKIKNHKKDIKIKPASKVKLVKKQDKSKKNAIIELEVKKENKNTSSVNSSEIKAKIDKELKKFKEVKPKEPKLLPNNLRKKIKESIGVVDKKIQETKKQVEAKLAILTSKNAQQQPIPQHPVNTQGNTSSSNQTTNVTHSAQSTTSHIQNTANLPQNTSTPNNTVQEDKSKLEKTLLDQMQKIMTQLNSQKTQLDRLSKEHSVPSQELKDISLLDLGKNKPKIDLLREDIPLPFAEEEEKPPEFSPDTPKYKLTDLLEMNITQLDNEFLDIKQDLLSSLGS